MWDGNHKPANINESELSSRHHENVAVGKLFKLSLLSSVAKVIRIGNHPIVFETTLPNQIFRTKPCL